jgi:hypothetical protein
MRLSLPFLLIFSILTAKGVGQFSAEVTNERPYPRVQFLEGKILTVSPQDVANPFYLSLQGFSTNLPKAPFEAKQPGYCYGVIREDFLVNDDVVGSCDQYFRSFAMNNSGSLVVSWTEEKEGSWDIYARCFDSTGAPVGASFRVNDNERTGCQYLSVVSMDESGNFVVCWQDDRNGDWDIYAQRYDGLCNPTGSNFRVNESFVASSQSYPSIAMDTSGRFVICWTDERSGDKDVYARRYDADGFPLDSSFRVNFDSGATDQLNSAVSMGRSGYFVICWQDRRGSNGDIYAQRYNSLGEPLGPNLRVNEIMGAVYSWSTPTVSVADSANFVVCWKDWRYLNWDIYGQRYISGVPEGGNFKINNDLGTSNQWAPSVSMKSNEGFIVCWWDDRGESSDIYAQIYDEEGSPIGANFRVNDDQGANFQVYPWVAMGKPSSLVICWQDYRNGNWDIYGQRYLSWVPEGINFKINDDLGTSNQWTPSVSMRENGSFVICWSDERNGKSDIFAQRYDEDCNSAGSNFRVNDVEGSASLWGVPDVDMENSGRFITCWQSSHIGVRNILVQRFNSSGISIDSNLIVNEKKVSADFSDRPSVAIDNQGRFAACWVDLRRGWDNADIYAQMYFFSGIPSGGNFRVNDDTTESRRTNPAMAMNSSGRFVICWEDRRNGDTDIYAQLYSLLGAPEGINFRANDDNGASYQGYPTVAMDSSGNFVICWEDERGGNADIYCQLYAIYGVPVGTNFRVSGDQGENVQKWPSVAIDGSTGKFVVCWEDERNGNWDIYAQKYYSDGSHWGSNYRVNQELDVRNPNQKLPSVAANSGRIVFAWNDFRRCKGGDVFAKVVDWDWAKVEDRKEEKDRLPRGITLAQNCPNPFNSTTTINYTLSVVGGQQSAVSLKIYNILGKEVRILVDERQRPGFYRVIWDGRDSRRKEVGSGIYFCRLEVEGKRLMWVKTRKMVLIK